MYIQIPILILLMVNEALDKLFKPYKVYFLYKESDNLESIIQRLMKMKDTLHENLSIWHSINNQH